METEKKTTAKAKTTTKEDSAKKTSAPKTTTKKVEDKAESKPKATKVAEKAVVTDTAVVEKSKAKTTKKENVKLDVKVEDIKKEIENKEAVTAKAKKETKAEVKTEPYKKKILFLAGESAPFIRTGGLGDVAGALPATLNALGADARVMLPLYMDIPQDFKNAMRYIGSVYVTLAWRYQYCGLFSYNYNGVTYYFVDNEYYFKRNGVYGHYDDAERFAFFSKACLEALRLIDFYPDVIHANDWHTALTPVFLDCFYRGIPEYQNIKTVFTIHNIEFQGKYGEDLITDILGLPEDRHSLVKYAKCSNFMKGAIEASNAVTTVSPSYANEIMDRYYS